MTGGLIRTAIGLQRAGKLDEAARLYEQILGNEPKQLEALYLLGTIHFQRGAFTQALVCFDSALAVKPNFNDALAARAATLSSVGRHEDALRAYDVVVAANPGHVQSWSNRGNALLTLGRDKDAIASYDRALGFMPDFTVAWRNRAAALLRAGEPQAALTSLDRALQLTPDFADAWEDRASVLMGLGRREEAIEAYNRAIALKPRQPDLLYNRGNAHAILQHYEEAIRDCEAVLVIDPDYPYARGVLIHSKLQSCDWTGLDAQVRNVSIGLAAGKRVVSPFNLKALSDSPAEHLRAAEIWTGHEAPPAPTPLAQDRRPAQDRIRLAYVSGDFNNSVVGTVMAEIFERHDRARFETIGISFGPDDKTPLRLRLEDAFERFIDVRGKTDHEIASMIRNMGVDIAVDLMGYTGINRSTIFSNGPAPLQVNYLGFPGSMGAPYFDYIIADSTVIPEGHAQFYAEKPAYLPHCYLPAIHGRAMSEHIPSRTEAELPETGFVFASFNNNYKINSAMFDIWMRLLRDVDGSFLWLRENNPLAKPNLTAEAEARGVAGTRLIFASAMPTVGGHLARLSLADLFLDTHPYNAHTTACDALWSGVPVLTLMGNSFAARVAASALKAIGLPELITETPFDYEAMALGLARNPAALADIRAKLARNRLTTPLFDAARFTRDLESAFASMWERHGQGQAPASFAVASAD